MSSTIVRQEIRAALQAWGAVQVPAVDWVETINANDRPPVGPWLTARFYGEPIQSLCLSGGANQESGTIDIFIFIPAGSGDAAATMLADAVGPHMMGLDLSAFGLEVSGYSPAADLFEGDAQGTHFGAIVSIEYRRFF